MAAFEGMNASVEPVETVLHGPVQDQAALYGLLDRIQALGLELLESAGSPACRPSRRSPAQSEPAHPTGRGWPAWVAAA